MPRSAGFDRPASRAIDRAVGAIVDPLCAALIVAEVVILALGVFTRYVLHNSLTWTDELATILFLWLAMLGAVAAYRRDGHMRLTALVRRLPPRGVAICETIAAVAVAIFSLELLAAVLWPVAAPPPASLGALVASIANGSFFASSYIGQEAVDFTPSLNLSSAYIVLAVVVALVLLLALAVLRLLEGDGRIVAGVVVAVGAMASVAAIERTAFAHLGWINLVLFFAIAVGGCIAVGVPIAFSFGIGTLSFLALSTNVPLSIVVGRMDGGISNIILLAVPLFVLLGLLIDITGISRRLVGAIAALVGHLQGGLNVVLVVAMFLVSGISGSKIADMAAVAPVLFPEMERRGHRRSEMIALLATSGAMAETIPPSLVLIIIGTVSSVSIQALFVAGFLPAAVVAACLVFVALVRSRREGVRAASAPSPRAIARAIVVALPGFALPLLIRWFVGAGIATATEVSTVGIVYAIAVGLLVYREFDRARVWPMLCETASLTGAIMLIIATATAMGWALTQSGFASALAAAIGNAPGGRTSFLALSVVLFAILGSVLEGIPAIVLFGPLLFPIARALGIHEVHYAIVAVLAMGIGLFAPPLGIGYYGACAIGKCDPGETGLRILPYLGALVVGLALVTAIPWLSTGFLAAR